VHRRRWLAVVGIVVVALGAAVGVFAYLWAHSGARPVSVDEARRRFSAGHGSAAAARQFTPAEGVYRYTGTGSESLSSPPKSQSEGPEIPGTVTHRGDDCWALRLDYSSNHWRKRKFCVRGDALKEVGNEVVQRWDFVVNTIENVATMTCRPPSVILVSDPAPGTEWPASCSGTNSQIAGTLVSSGTHRYVGSEEVRVGASTVNALHFRDERTVSGAQTGTETFEVWLAPNGLPVRGRQRIEVDSDSPIGRVTYTQEGAFSLVRLTPST
jgi:hypothetical protein